ncbi:hypothetical protein Dimus_036699 [Dionaea muscipula]
MDRRYGMTGYLSWFNFLVLLRFKCIDLDGNGEVIVLHSWKPDAVIAEEEQDWNVLSVKERSGWNVLSMLRNKT